MLLIWLEVILRVFASGSSDTGLVDGVRLSPLELAKKTIQHTIELTADINEDLYVVHLTADRQRYNNMPFMVKRTKRTKRDVNDQAIMLKWENLMTRQNYGFCSATIVSLLDTIVDKEGRDLQKLIDVFGKVILRKSSEGELKILGNFLESRLKLLVYWTSLLPVQTIQSFAHNVKEAIGNQTVIGKEIDEILLTCDTFFTADDGEHLLSIVTSLYEYNSYLYEALAIAEQLMENLVDALLAPANYRQDPAKLEIFISMLNKIYNETLPEFWRSEIDEMVKTITRYDLKHYKTQISVTSKEGHVKHIHYKRIQPGFKKTLHHLFRKHPEFYKNLIDYRSVNARNIYN